MESSLTGKTVYIGGKKPKEKTVEQKRGDILEAKLVLLNDYILKNMASPSGKSLADFLKENNTTKEEFTKGLPDGLNNPDSNDLDGVIAYATKLNDEYFKQFILHGKKTGTLSADGVVGIDYLPANGVVGVDFLAMADGSGVNLNSGGPGFFIPPNIDPNVLYNPAFPRPASGVVNGPGIGYIPSHDDIGHWVETAAWGDATQTELREALKKAYYFVNEYGRQLGEKQNENDAVNSEIIGRRLDDVATVIDVLTKRLEGTLTAYQALHVLDDRHVADVDLIKANNTSPKSKGAFDKLKAALQKVADITKQDWHSIGVGLGKSPKEILDDLKNEAKKDVKDVKANAIIVFNVLNKLNPVAVAGRASMLGMLNTNAFGMATHFNVLRSNPTLWTKALDRWTALGGDNAVFSSAITNGKGKPRIFEGALKLVHRSADGSFSANAEDAQKAVDATLQAKKDYDDAVKKNKGTNIAATSLGVIAGSTAAIGGLLTAGVFGPDGIPVGPPVVAGGGTLASFIPIINQMKIGVGIRPDDTPPQTNPIVGPLPGDPAPNSGPDSSFLSSSITKWVVGTLVVAGLSFGIYKYVKS